MLIGNANLSSISIDNQQTATNPASAHHIINLKTTLGDKPTNKQKIKIEIVPNSGIAEIRWFKYINGWEPYNFLDNNIGLWVPVNMYSSNLKREEKGLLFSAMPIGVAWGGKYNISQKFYIGISGALNYTLSEYNDSTQTKSKAYFFHDFSFGPLIDIGGYCYIGYMLPVNLTNQKAKMEPQYVVGFGLRIAEILQGKKSSTQ